MKHCAGIPAPIAALVLVGCSGKPANKSAPEAAPEAAASEKSANNATTIVGGHGSGTVKAVDPVAGKITLDHGPISEASWPAMTMTFEANPAILKNVAPGDKVTFAMIMSGGSAKVTSIQPR